MKPCMACGNPIEKRVPNYDLVNMVCENCAAFNEEHGRPPFYLLGKREDEWLSLFDRVKALEELEQR